MDTIQSELRKANIELDASVLNSLRSLPSTGFLSFGWPQASVRLPHFIWFPEGPPRQKPTAIVSSRLGRKLDRQDDIFRLLRTACSQLDPRSQMLITSAGTATHSFVLRAAELFGIPILELCIAPPKQSIDDWLTAIARESGDELPDEPRTRKVCLVSPALAQESAGDGKPRDQLLVMSCHQLLVLHARSRGTLVTQLSQRLAGGEPTKTFLAVGSDQLVPVPIAESLMQQGAIGWFVPAADEHEGEAWNFPMEGRTAEPPAPIISWQDRDDELLTHCTRRAKGAWPDQSTEEFLDELIFGEPRRDRSSLAALMRIIAMRKLLASGESIRGGTRVVSFTAANRQEIRKMRTFRAHRGRWDFEPYGICIDRKLAMSLGAREVIYGDEASWDSMSPEDRPFFQKIPDDGSGIDWRVEREWRCLGDVDLHRIPSTHAVVFVPTQVEAQHVARISHWPVAVLGPDKE